MSPKVRSRMETLLAGSDSDASAGEFTCRDLCFMAACAEYAGSQLTVRESRIMSVSERALIRTVSPNRVVFSPA